MSSIDLASLACSLSVVAAGSPFADGVNVHPILLIQSYPLTETPVTEKHRIQLQYNKGDCSLNENCWVFKGYIAHSSLSSSLSRHSCFSATPALLPACSNRDRNDDKTTLRTSRMSDLFSNDPAILSKAAITFSTTVELSENI